MCALLFVCTEIGGVSQNVLCTRRYTSAWIWWAVSFRVELEEIVVVCESPLPFPPKKPFRLRQYVFSLFLMSCLYVCIWLFLVSLSFFSSNCIILKTIVIYSLLSSTFIFYRPSYIAFFTAAFSALLDQLYVTYWAGTPSFYLSSHFFSVCVWHIRSLWSCESTAKDLSLSLFLSGQTDTTVWGCVEDYGIATLWCGEAGDVAA